MADIRLTAAQQAVVDSEGGALLVSAAAGSGKTKVLVDRLLKRVLEGSQPHNIDEFLVITYTKAAASELRLKIAQELSRRLAAAPDDRHLQHQLHRIYLAEISTVHAFCGNLLRTYAHLLDLPADFRVAEEAEAQALREKVLDTLLEELYTAEDSDFLAMASIFGYGRDDRRLPGAILQIQQEMRCRPDMTRWRQETRETLDLSRYGDAAETPWGAYLLSEFRRFLTRQIEKFQAALQEMAQYPKIEKGLAPCFTENLRQMEALLSCESWDAVVSGRIETFGRVGMVRQPEDAAVKERLSKVRSLCWSELKAWQELFFAPSQAVLADLRETTGALQTLLDVAAQFDEAYAAEKARRRVLDFSDLEHQAIRLLVDRYTGAPTATAREVASRYREILVDEYQDSNAVQDVIFEAISQGGQNRFMVGDVKQSIYRFRLADPTIFLEKYLSYADAPAPEGVPRRIFLSDNFRSRPEVVAAVNAVFGCIMSRRLGELDYDERAALRAAGSFEGGVPLPEIRAVAVPEADEDGEQPAKSECEAAEAARIIRSLVEGGAPVTENGARRAARYGDVAILLRSANVSGAAFRRALEREGVPVQSGVSEGFFSSPVVRMMLSLLSVIDNPRRDVPLIAALSSPLFGFTPDELAAIRIQGDGGEPFYDCLERAAEGDGRCRAFLDTLGALRALARDAELSALLQEVYARLDVFALCSAMPDGEARRAQLARLFELAKRFEATLWRGLHRFLGWLRLLEDRGAEPMGAEAAEGGAVTVMSIHRSKGLEFPIVLLCDTARRFNRQDTAGAVLMHHELGLGPRLTDAARGIEYPTIARRAIARRTERETLSEEMRLLYVAMTRAKERLIITCALRDPEKELEKLALSATKPMAAEVLAGMSSPAQWLISAALADGGAHIALSTVYPGGEERRVLPNAPAAEDASAQRALEERAYARMCAAFAWEYPHRAAEGVPSKITATELKSLYIPDEEAEHLLPRGRRTFRRPDLGGERDLSAAERGTATHLALRYIDLAAAAEEGGARRELERLLAEGRLTPEEAAAVDAAAIARLARSQTGRLITNAPRVLREFPFSVLCPAGKFIPGAPEDEEVLLQGVVDCCLLDEDGVTVIDYKTDRVDAAGAAQRARGYLPQLEAYAWALSRVTGKAVRRRIVYFLSCGAAVEL